MEITISYVDPSPKELDSKLPIVINLLRELPGNDRSDYWLGKLKNPIKTSEFGLITHVVLAACWVGQHIDIGASNLIVAIAYVTDQSLLDNAKLDFSKCMYIAQGTAHETTGGKVIKESEASYGHIRPFFGVGKSA